MDYERIKKGIAAYSHEQEVLLRLMKKRGGFTSKEFDGWFVQREFRRPCLKLRAISNETFLLSMDSYWEMMVEILHMMVKIGIVKAKIENSTIVYGVEG